LVYASTLDTRGDITELHEHAPDLAGPFEDLRQAINLADHESSAPAPVPATAVVPDRRRDLTARRAQLNEQWDEALTRIRQRAGLSRFLLPPPIDALRRSATGGPVVYLTVFGERGHALIVRDARDHPVDVLELPAAVTATAVTRWADTLLTAQHTATDHRQAAAQRRAAQQRMHDVLRWTWDAVAEPVLRHLGHLGPPPARSRWPRVWWCPVGVVSFLPLHAAGHHVPPYTDTVLDRVISSYTPTIRALAHARRRRPVRPSTVVIAVPDAPESSPLDGAGAEAGIVRRFIPHATVLPPAGAPTSHDSVVAALREHAIAHLACHGLSNRRDPTASRLLLHDHRTNPLTLHNVTQLRLEHAELAYLSACSTTDNNPLQSDEATHLTGAFQLAGYPSVIGTLWPINDDTATAVAFDVYATLTRDGTRPPNPGLAAEALHRAVRHQRDRTPALPTRWAAYLHAGT
jgi:CHAT domain